MAVDYKDLYYKSLVEKHSLEFESYKKCTDLRLELLQKENEIQKLIHELTLARKEVEIGRFEQTIKMIHLKFASAELRESILNAEISEKGGRPET